MSEKVGDIFSDEEEIHESGVLVGFEFDCFERVRGFGGEQSVKFWSLTSLFRRVG